MQLRYALHDRQRRRRREPVRPAPSCVDRALRPAGLVPHLGARLHAAPRPAATTRSIPTRGFDLDLSQDFAGLGGNVHYVETECGRRLVPRLQQGLRPQPDRAGPATSTAGTATRPHQRPLLRGRRHLPAASRSPASARATPSLGDALGGKLYVIGAVEQTFPNGLPEQYGIKTALFADIGTLGLLDASDKVDPLDQPAADHRAATTSAFAPRSASASSGSRRSGRCGSTSPSRSQRALRHDPGLPLLHQYKVLENSSMNVRSLLVAGLAAGAILALAAVSRHRPRRRRSPAAAAAPPHPASARRSPALRLLDEGQSSAARRSARPSSAAHQGAGRAGQRRASARSRQPSSTDEQALEAQQASPRRSDRCKPSAPTLEAARRQLREARAAAPARRCRRRSRSSSQAMLSGARPGLPQLYQQHSCSILLDGDAGRRRVGQSGHGPLAPGRHRPRRHDPDADLRPRAPRPRRARSRPSAR